MKFELVSVIIPVYKVEAYLDKCVQSIVSQTYKNLEIILVDDGSPDGCPAMCEEWAKRDTRIRVVHKPNGGLSSARNAGIEVATGKFLTFVDSDDYLEPEMIEVLYKILKDNNADMSYCTANWQWKNKTLLSHELYKNQVKTFAKQELLWLLKNKSQTNITCAWGKLYKKEIFDNIKYPVGRLAEDTWVIHKILGNINCCAYINKPLYNYVQRKNSIMDKPNKKLFVDIKEAIDDRHDFLMQNRPNDICDISQIYFKDLKWLYFLVPFKEKKLLKEIKSKLKNKTIKKYNQSKKYKLFYFSPILAKLYNNTLAKFRKKKQNFEKFD